MDNPNTAMTKLERRNFLYGIQEEIAQAFKNRIAITIVVFIVAILSSILTLVGQAIGFQLGFDTRLTDVEASSVATKQSVDEIQKDIQIIKESVKDISKEQGATQEDVKTILNKIDTLYLKLIN